MFLASIGLQSRGEFSRGDFFYTGTDFDRERIANTFASFYGDNQDAFLEYKESGLKKDESFAKLVGQLSECGSYIVALYDNNPAEFRQDFFMFEEYVKKNMDALKTQLGDEKFRSFFCGVYYVQQVLLNLR